MRYSLLFLLLLSLDCQSQTWVEMRKTTNELFNKGDYVSARKSAETVLLLAEKEFGKLDSNYATSLLEYGTICLSTDELTVAEKSFAESLLIRKNIFGKNSAEYSKVLHEISRLKRTQGDYKSSEEILLSAIGIIDSLEKPNYSVRMDYNNTLGFLYMQKGEYDKGIEIYEANLSLLRPDQNTSPNKLWEVINNLAGIYNLAGKYHKAEPLLIEAVEIYSNDSTQLNRYAISLSNLGTHYSKLGNYEKAESQLLKAIEIRLKSSGNKSKEYATTIANLAIVYNRMKSYEKAEALFIEALDIHEHTTGKSSPAYATSLVNLADFYISIHQYEKANPLLIEGKEIRKKILGESHPDYANVLRSIASMHFGMEKDSSGTQILKEAIHIYRKTEMIYHPFYLGMISNMAKSYEENGELDSAEKYHIEINKISLDGIQSQFSFQSESEKEKYLRTILIRFEKFIAFTYHRKNTNDTITRTAYDLLLKTKGALLKSTSALRNSILNGNDSSLIQQYQDWVNLNKKINVLKSQSLEKRKENLEKLQEKSNSLEKQLIAGSNYLAEYNRLSNFTWRQVRESLDKNEAAIEFTQFRINKDSVFYCAFLIKKETENPIMIRLFEQKEMTGLFDAYKGNDEEKIRMIYGEKNSKKHHLYNIIWKPLDSHLKNVKKIRLSLSGILHKISFAAITDEKGESLVQKYELDVTSTTASFGINSTFSLLDDDVISLFGGAEFSIEDKTHAPWSYLKGTEEELDHLKNVMVSEKYLPSIFSGVSADEKNFRKQSQKSTILHLATHGFFFADPEITREEAKSKVIKIDSIRFRGNQSDAYHEHFSNKDPMQRSGIVLSGANDYWNGITSDEMNNGILTASEVSNLDLRKVKLTVLSACESGLGDINSNEGVYGLQRAFKMAGTNYLLMSLWKVPDHETAIFMEKFYTHLFEEKNIRIAFRKTQKLMSKKYDPFYWGAFVLMD